MPELLLEVRDSSGTLVEKTNRVLFLEESLPVDQVGRVKTAVPVNDPIVQYLDDIGKYLWFYSDWEGVSQASRTPLTVAGIYNLPKREVIGGQDVLTLETFNRGADLLYKHNAEDSLWTGHQLGVILGTSAGTPPGLLYGTGWTLDIEAGVGLITRPFEFNGEAVLEAIRKVCADAYDGSYNPVHWWLDPVEKKLYVGILGTSSGIRFAQADAPDPDGTLPVTILEKLAERGTGALVNYLYVYGGSSGADRVTIQGASGGAYAVQSGTSRMGATYYYIKDTASISAYGEFRDEFNDNSANTRNLTATQARNLLYHAACAELRRSKDPHKAWSAAARGATLDTLVPGKSVHLWYHRDYEVELLTGATLQREEVIDATAYITKITRRLSDDGDEFSFDLGSTLDHKIGSSKEEALAQRIAQAAKAAGNRSLTRVVTAGSTPSPGAAPDNAPYVTTAAVSGLSAEVVYNTIAGSLGGFADLTISSGGVAKPANAFCLSIDTEGGAASDDLDAITGGGEGDIIVIKAANSAHTVRAKDGTGNLKLAGDCTLDNVEDRLLLHHDGTNWVELSRSDNAT